MPFVESCAVLVKKHLGFLKKEVHISIFYKAKLFAVRERPRCSSRTTALPFAKGSAALREQQIKTTSRNRGTDVGYWEIGCTLFCCGQLWNRLYALHHLHVNLYAVSAINHKSFIMLWCIGGHWQVKTETRYCMIRILSLALKLFIIHIFIIHNLAKLVVSANRNLRCSSEKYK